MKTIILDASIILNYLLVETPTTQKSFDKILESVATGKATFLSTHLLPLEIANALRFKFKNSDQSNHILKVFFDLPIKYKILSKNDLKHVCNLAYTQGTTIYDTSYHLLAIKNNGTLITSDKKYFAKAESLAHIQYLE